MRMKWIVPVVYGLIVIVVGYFDLSAGAMLAGGAPCLIIINEGGRAYGAIEHYKAGGGQADTSILEAAVLTSCSLVQYGAVEKRFEDEYLEGPILEKIGAFHATLIAGIGQPNYNIDQEAQKLERYNRKLCNLIESGTYPD